MRIVIGGMGNLSGIHLLPELVVKQTSSIDPSLLSPPVSSKHLSISWSRAHLLGFE